MSYLLFIVCFLLGWKFREYTAVRKINKFIKSVEDKPESTNRVMVKMERHGEMIYVYDKEDKFLTQGKNKEEIQINLQKKFGNVNMVFHATSENVKEVNLT